MSHLQALIFKYYSFLCLSRTIAMGIPLCITKPGLSPGFVTVLRLRSGGSRITYAAVEGVEFIDLLFRDQYFPLIYITYISVHVNGT